MSDCPCKKMLAVLEALGARHTARMHASGAGANPDNWSAQDWLLHMDEEERLVFPYFPRWIVKKLEAEHLIFRAQLKRYGRLDPCLIHEHAALEDEVIAKLF